MERKMKRFSLYAIIVILVIILLLPSGYIIFNRSNPHIIELIIGSVALGILVGIVPTLISSLLHGKVEARTVVATLVTFCCLAILVAVLVYSTNTPKDVHREIAVAYLVNPNTKGLPSNLRFPEVTASLCYTDVTVMFSQFREKNPGKVEDLFSRNIAQNYLSSLRIFHDLTEYLIPYFIGHPFTSAETELTRYHKTTPKWLGFPDKSIVDQPKSMDHINGPIKENLFYGKGLLSLVDTELHIPKDTTITLEKESDLASKYVIKNNFVIFHVRISVYVFVKGRVIIDNCVVSLENCFSLFFDMFCQW